MKELLLSILLLTGNYAPATSRFVNTNWVGKVSNKCVESINLRGGSYSVRYNQKSAQTYRGCYTVAKDTLIIKERDDFGNAVAYRRIKFVLKDHELHYYSHEELVNHQWVKSKVKADKSCVFTRV
ncbi:MAG: hypothetical protein EOP42_28560 [Sphingobacteriaceae bacterium]|nr:MAG: hypothetical protein EOP42_28560 [Sphingobacteriaceae bacterium]